MNDSATSLVADAQPGIERSASRPEIFRRRFECGHPDEFIEMRRDDCGDQVHNLIPLELFEECSRRFGKLPAYRQARCLKCARVAKEQDDNDPEVRGKRTLGAYQADVSSAATKTIETSASRGFEKALHGRHHCHGRNTAVQPHRRVSEDEHRAHRLDVQGKAVERAGKWLAVPARRVWNMPIQTKVAPRPAARQQDASHVSEKEETGHHAEPEAYPGKGVIASIVDIPCGRISKVNDESFRRDAIKTISLSGSKLERQKKRSESIAKSDESNPSATNSDSAFLDHATEAHHLEDAPEVASPGEGSAFMKHLGNQPASPFDDASNSPLPDLRFEYPRSAPVVPPTPAVPKKGALDFMKRRSSTSTRKSTHSEPISINFRKLGIDVQSARSTKKTEPDGSSPDWACRTSLAIERGRLSMDSVGIQTRELTSSRHIAQAMRPDERTPVSAQSGACSESAPQAVRAIASQESGPLLGMEMASVDTEPSRHDNAQVAPSFDLNKSLPALPSQESVKDEDV